MGTGYFYADEPMFICFNSFGLLGAADSLHNLFCEKRSRGIDAPVFVLFLPARAKRFPKKLQTTTIPAWPALAIHSLISTAEAGKMEYIDVLPAFLVISSWLLMSGATAIWKFQKKDL